MNKLKKAVLIIIWSMIFSIVVLLPAWGIWEVFLSEVVPHSRTFFLTYESYQKRCGGFDIPESASDLKYYYFEGYLEDKNGFREVVSEEDFELEQEKYISYYTKEFGEEGSAGCLGFYLYDGGDKEYIDLEEMSRHGIDFIDRLIDEEEMENYYFVAYVEYDFTDDHVWGEGVICNDETNEVIIYEYQVNPDRYD